METHRISSFFGRRAVSLAVLFALFLVVLVGSTSDSSLTHPSGAAAQEVDLESPADVATDLQPPDTGCAPGSLPPPPAPDRGPDEQDSTLCVPVVDRRDAVATPIDPQPLEGHFAAASQSAGGGQSSIQGDPIPQGIADAGTMYLNDQLPVTYSATFRAYLRVYPENIAYEWDNDPEEVAGYYITATNRTQKGVEFLFRIRESQGDPAEENGWFQIYDWSCITDWPCDNGFPGVPGTNAFVRAWRLDAVPCWYEMLNANDHYTNLTYYRNSTWIVEPRNPPADPPLWRNSVSLYNYCTGQYDVIYSHDYAYNQSICAFTHDCGGWAGIAERFPATSQKPPVMLRQEFSQQELDYDAQTTRLRPWNSYFIDPSAGAPQWTVYAHWDHDWWGAGTYEDDDGDDIPNASDPDMDGDGIPNGVEIICGTTAPPGYVPERHPYRIPERIDGAYAGEDDDGDGLVDEALPPALAADCDQDGFSGSVEKSVFSRATNLDDQFACAETAAQNDEADDRWPADFDDNKTINIVDVLALKVVFGSPSARHDLDASGGNINILDVLAMSPVFGKVCSTPPG